MPVWSRAPKRLCDLTRAQQGDLLVWAHRQEGQDVSQVHLYIIVSVAQTYMMHHQPHVHCYDSPLQLAWLMGTAKQKHSLRHAQSASALHQDQKS